jgi:hypothetical protein
MQKVESSSLFSRFPEEPRICGALLSLPYSIHQTFGVAATIPVTNLRHRNDGKGFPDVGIFRVPHPHHRLLGTYLPL